MYQNIKPLFAVIALGCLTIAESGFAQGTAFTYQGRLNDSGAPANGLYDFKLTLFDAATNGTSIAGPLTNAAVAVSNGLFTTTMDFGSVFEGNLYWLRIQARTNGSGAFSTLAPRQQLTPTPYAEFATTASNLSGTISFAQLPPGIVTNNESALTLTGNFSGNGGGLTNVNAGTLNGLSSGNFWQLGGNNVGGGKFIGSTNNQPVEIWANGQRALRLEPDTTGSGAPNVIGGSPNNFVNAGGVIGGFIGGGGAQNYNGAAYSNNVAAYFGTIGGGLGNVVQAFANGGFIGGGYGNVVQNSSTEAVIGGGGNNQAGGTFSFVGGGSTNTAQGNYSTIGGGQNNAGLGKGNVIGGGLTNSASGLATTIGGGQNNSATANSAVVAGGDLNMASAPYSTVGGGYDNNVTGQYGIIAGGNNNFALGTSATVGGGYNNNASGQNSTVGGGGGGSAGGFGSTVGGGWINQASSDYSTVAGGENNFAVGTNAAVGGGYNNVATNASTIAGGSQNQALGLCSTVGGGFGNYAYDYSVVGGGSANYAEAPESTVCGGIGNHASGQYAIVAGGAGNSAIGANSFAAGNLAVANNAGSFVWSDGYYGSEFQDTGPFQFLIHAQGGVGINWVNPGTDALSIGGTERMNNKPIYFRASPDVNHGLGYFGNGTTFAGTSPDGPVLFGFTGGVLGTEQNGTEHIALSWTTTSVTVNGTFNNNSDRNAKEHFASVSAARILEKVSSLPVSEWNYKTDAATRHIGPMAQDFYATFNVGTDETHIAPIDEGGVALAAIQGLNEKVEVRSRKSEDQIEELKAENAKLKRANEAMEQKLDALQMLVQDALRRP